MNLAAAQLRPVIGREEALSVDCISARLKQVSAYKVFMRGHMWKCRSSGHLVYFINVVQKD